MAMREHMYVGFKTSALGFDAHLTLHYLGLEEFVDHQGIEQVIKPYKGLTYYATRVGIDLFGPDNNIPVVTVALPTSLYNLKDLLESVYPSPSEYEFDPHITLKFRAGETIHIPELIPINMLGIY